MLIKIFFWETYLKVCDKWVHLVTFLFIIHIRPLRIGLQEAALQIVLTSLWLEIFSCWGSSSSLPFFLTVTKLKSIEVPGSDFTFCAAGCGPCWGSVPPSEVLVFICAILMAQPLHVFPWEPGIHCLALFLCVFLFTPAFNTTGWCFLCLQVSGPRDKNSHFQARSHPHGCVRGRPRAGCVGSRALCFLHCSPWGEGRRKELGWALPVIMLCDLMGVW